MPAEPMPSTDTEHFYEGWVQLGRETGEQIMLLGWRLPDGEIEAMVFLLNWRGAGLKDYYRTRNMTAAEWRQLVEHNGSKGAPLVRIMLADGCALLVSALAEGQRFSQPLPRDYKLDARLAQQRILGAGAAPTTMRSFLSPDLTPAETIEAYIAALHYRDYTLTALLLMHDHPMRLGKSLEQAAADLRASLKHVARREAQIDKLILSDTLTEDARSITVEAHSQALGIERSGRRIRHNVRERYTLCRTASQWLIASIEEMRT